GKMDHQLSSIAEKEWTTNATEIKKKNPTMDLSQYTKQLKDNYTTYIKGDIERKLAIKSLGVGPFEKSDSVLWNQYRDAVDPLDEWNKFSDETMTSIANFVAYDLSSMLISGGVAGLIGRGAVWATKGVMGAERVAQVSSSAGKMNSLARTTGAITRAGIEGTSFTAIHAGVRNQEWFLNQPNPVQQIIINSLGFGLFRSASSGQVAKLFSGIENPMINGLLKQGLIVPAIITGVQTGLFDYTRLANKDPSVWNDIWSNFLLNAAMGGLFMGFAKKSPTGEQSGVVKTPKGEVPVHKHLDGKIDIEVPGINNTTNKVTITPNKELSEHLNKTPETNVRGKPLTSNPAPPKVNPTEPSPVVNKVEPTHIQEVHPGQPVIEGVLDNSTQFGTWMEGAIPKYHKKNHPVGSVIKFGDDMEVKILDKGAYEVNYKGKTQTYDTHADLSANIGKIIKTPEERLALIKSTESVKFDFKKLDMQMIPETDGLRFKSHADGKIGVQKKNPTTNAWEDIDMNTLTPNEAMAAEAHFFGKTTKDIQFVKTKLEGAHLDDAVSHAEKQSFIKKHGLAAWHKLQSGFNTAKDKTIGGGKFLLWEAPTKTLGFLTGINQGRQTLKGALAWSTGVEIADLIFDPEEREWSLENAGEFIFRLGVLRYMGVLSGTAALTLQNYITSKFNFSNNTEVPQPSPTIQSQSTQSQSMPSETIIDKSETTI
ncbi:hypothetical protein K2X92_04070, partial [Candidatus Gracilibacteria bacterium]|nr:hypothetical protein [Candidatus Gracilibacteria bacterium]